MKKTLLLFFVATGMLSLSACQSTEKKEALAPNTLRIGTKKVSLEKMKADLKEVTLEYQETFGKDKQRAVGFELIDILQTYLGDNWKDMDAVLFTALDGYKAEVPVSRILKYKAVLSYRYEDAQKSFTFEKELNRFGVIELGPYYLVWDNIKNPQLWRERSYSWPYKIVQIDSIKHQSQYANNLKKE